MLVKLYPKECDRVIFSTHRTTTGKESKRARKVKCAKHAEFACTACDMNLCYLHANSHDRECEFRKPKEGKGDGGV